MVSCLIYRIDSNNTKKNDSINTPNNLRKRPEALRIPPLLEEITSLLSGKSRKGLKSPSKRKISKMRMILQRAGSAPNYLKEISLTKHINGELDAFY